MNSVRRLAIAAAIGSLAFSFAATSAQTSPRSSELIDRGLEDLQKSEWDDALRKFLAASAADPSDSEAQFFQGVALNRMSLHREALAQIELARKGNVRNSQLNFEYGWALLGSGRFSEALDVLKAFKADNPDSGKASELIGRAELSLGNTDNAEAAFAEAVRLNPSLQASVDFFRATRAQAQSDSIAQQEYLSAVAGNSQNGPLTRTMRQHLQLLRTLRPVERAKPWSVFGTFAVGRNSNVIALSEDVAQPADITRKDSRYYDVTAGGQYRLDLDPTQSITVGTILNHRNYGDISGNDTHTINLFARYDQQITPRLLGGVTASFGHVRVDGDKKQNTVGISPRLQYRINDRLSVDGYVSAQKINLPSPTRTPGVLDRDSKLYSAGGNVNIAFPSLMTDLSFGVAVMNNSAVGSDYDYGANRYFFSGRTQLPWEVVLGAGVTRTNYDYKNLNSLAPTTPPGATAFGFERDDAITTFTLDLSRPINETVTAFIRGSRTNANSNLNVFTYDQKDIQIGVIARF